MAFALNHDANGLLYVARSWNLAERWQGHNTYDHENRFDWKTVTPGTRFVIESVCRPRHLPPVFHQREDGLYEVDFVRVKVESDQGYEWQKPVFASTLDPKKRTDRANGAFAFANDPVAVDALVQFFARQRDETMLADLFTSYANAVKDERRRQRLAEERGQREQELRRKAAEAGVTYEELLDGMKLWNSILRKRYAPNRCFWCGRPLTDPASIVSGIGPECIKRFPGLLAAARAKVIDIGRLRFDADRLLDRFERAGMAEIATVIRAANAHEELVTTPPGE